MEAENLRLKQQIAVLTAKIKNLQDYPFYSAYEVKKILGCADSKLSKLCKDKLIPSVKIGGTTFFPKLHFTHVLVLESYKGYNGNELKGKLPDALQFLKPTEGEDTAV